MPGWSAITSDRMRLLLVLAALGGLLLATSIRGAFAVDEEHYLASLRALSRGGVEVPDFDGLGASRELAFFDPAAQHRPAGFTSTNAPPLYAVLALPFYPLGWLGLVALNVLAFLACAATVFLYARDHAEEPRTAWLALGIYVLGGFSIEYASGLWPHLLSVALCMGGVLLSGRVRSGGPVALAAVSGLLTGLAVGIRYQNVVLAAVVGLGIAIWSRRRLASGAAYGLGVGVPIAGCSIFNQLRMGSYNPISKGKGYLSLTAGRRLISAASGKGAGRALWEPLHVLWAKLVDFAAHPPMPNVDFYQLQNPDPRTGAYLYIGRALKKALLQSTPWSLMSLTMMALAWWSRNVPAAGQRRELRAMSLVVAAFCAVVALAGFARHDGLCFNQRYFLELLPLLAVALAWAFERLDWRPGDVAAGGVIGVALVGAVLYTYDPGAPVRHHVLLKAPLLVAVALAAAWILGQAKQLHRAAAVVMGLCLGWALAVHVGEDLRATRWVRELRRIKLEAVERVLPPGPAAIFAHADEKDGLGLLQLDHDLLIVNPHVDGGRDAPRLADAMLAGGRRVFVLLRGMPITTYRSIAGGRHIRVVAARPYEIVELLPPSG